LSFAPHSSFVVFVLSYLLQGFIYILGNLFFKSDGPVLSGHYIFHLFPYVFRYLSLQEESKAETSCVDHKQENYFLIKLHSVPQ